MYVTYCTPARSCSLVPREIITRSGVGVPAESSPVPYKKSFHLACHMELEDETPRFVTLMLSPYFVCKPNATCCAHGIAPHSANSSAVYLPLNKPKLVSADNVLLIAPLLPYCSSEATLYAAWLLL